MTSKKSLWLIGGLVLAALGAAAFSPLFASGGAQILITVDGAEYARVPLGSVRQMTIHQENGAENVLLIEPDGFSMLCASCRDQLCIGQGKVTAQNASLRALGGSVICLPNRVSCTLIADEADSPLLPDV